jgi:hypothetical protein
MDERRELGAAELIAEYHQAAIALWRAVEYAHAHTIGHVGSWTRCPRRPCRGSLARITRWRRLAGRIRASQARRELTWRAHVASDAGAASPR